MKNNIKLKPCPFCGGKPEIENKKMEGIISYRSVGVWCRKCWFGLCTSVIDEKNVEMVLKNNIKHWNTRI